jgi:hypothetical protein
MSFDAKRGIHVDWETADVLEWFLSGRKTDFIKDAGVFGHEEEEAENMYYNLKKKLHERLHA